MNDTDVTLNKVCKLLTLAEDPAATPAESEAFTAKATQLMADYGIDQALLAYTATDKRQIADRMIRLHAPYARDKCSLASAIAHRSRCEAVSIQNGSTISLHVFGHETDLICVEILLTSLLLQGTRELTGTPVPPRQHVAAYRRSWWAGFAMSIVRRLADAERRSVEESDRLRPAGDISAALVVADRSREAMDALRRAYPHLRNAPRRRLSGGGSRDGFASGQRANLDVRSALNQQNGNALTR